MSRYKTPITIEQQPPPPVTANSWEDPSPGRVQWTLERGTIPDENDGERSSEVAHARIQRSLQACTARVDALLSDRDLRHRNHCQVLALPSSTCAASHSPTSRHTSGPPYSTTDRQNAPPVAPGHKLELGLVRG